MLCVCVCTSVSHTAVHLVRQPQIHIPGDVISLHAGTGVELALQHQCQSGCHDVEIIQSRQEEEKTVAVHTALPPHVTSVRPITGRTEWSLVAEAQSTASDTDRPEQLGFRRIVT